MPQTDGAVQHRSTPERFAQDVAHRHGADRRGHDSLLSDLVRPVPCSRSVGGSQVEASGPEDTEVDEDGGDDFGECPRTGDGR